MKYTIETTQDGIVETLEIRGAKISKSYSRFNDGTVSGLRTKDSSFEQQLLDAGLNEDFAYAVSSALDDGSAALDLHDLSVIWQV